MSEKPRQMRNSYRLEPEGPAYVSGTAIGLLNELATAMEDICQRNVGGGQMDALIVGPDDAKAIRWALDIVQERRQAQ